MFAKKVLDDVHPTEKLEHWRGDHAFAGVEHRGVQVYLNNKP